MLRLPGKLRLVGKLGEIKTNDYVVQALVLTFLTTHEKTIDDLIILLRMLAISYWISGNGMYHITYE